MSRARCPYTDEPCRSWDCKNCSVTKEELEWMEELDKELEEGEERDR